MPKTLLALGGSIESLPILRRAKELGHRLIVVDGNPAAPGMELADAYLVSSCYHTETVNKLIEARHAGMRFDGVICAAIDAPHVASAVAEAFGLPGLTVEQAGLGADKWLQWHKLFTHDIPIPMAYLADDKVTMPSDKFWVVKPLDSRGARGVIRVPRGNGGGWHYIVNLVKQVKAHSPSGRTMVEEWLDGPQLSTESLVQDGKVLFTAVGLRNYSRLEEFAPYCIEDGFDEPSIDNTIWLQHGGEWHLPQGGITKTIEESCRALNWFQRGGGVVKGDIVIHDEKLYVIELAPRLSGGLFCAAHELCYGVDFIGAAINMALGYTIDAPKPYPRQFVSQRYIFPAASDIGKRITAQEEGEFGAVFAHYSKSIGYVIQPVTAHPDRLGQALCVGANPQEARERAERAVMEMYNGMVIE